MIEELLAKVLKDLGVGEAPNTRVNRYGVCTTSLKGTYGQLNEEVLQKKLGGIGIYIKRENGNTQIVLWPQYQKLPGDPEEVIRSGVNW